ncbi:M81 family metallopeptidase [Sphingomonas sp. SM33]|uniref:Microcystinase C n=1 Tax=Sphingomonas telluris TaxID=2907998 RepID=A0ABS9VNT5_9SPHN|nr:M81 family metallopeptidase [Sphingomonas telluris]MCH8616627.1 M81 family metallopeptidase [Sphingomonas telluris]
MRVFIGGLATETNTFAPFPTALSAFEEYGIGRDTSLNDSSPLGGPLKVFRSCAEADGCDVVETITSFAQPGGPTVRAVYERLRDTILDDLSAAGAVDIVVLMLHGAMVAQGYDDCEGDLITRVRGIAPNAVVGVELDPHCHLTSQMVSEADVIIIAKEYPHIDFDDRARELYALCRRIALGEVAPVAVLLDTKMVGFYPTFDPPMRQIVDGLTAAETGPILSMSLAHGFPWADVEDVGTRVLVYADQDEDAAVTVARDVAATLYEQRHALLPDYPGVDDSIDRLRQSNGQVVLGDFADNPGGGAPGDSTFILRALLERELSDVVIGAFWDPLVAQVCAEAGVGAILDVRLGGKCGPTSGEPIDLEVEVRGVVENHSAGVFGQRQPMGRSVWLHSRGIDIAVCSIRTQVYERDAFTGLGIPLEDRRLIVVKSSNHYQAGFRADADHLWHVTSPGTLRLDFARMPYTKRNLNFFPREADPWASGAPEPEVFSRDAVRASSLAAHNR